MPQPINFKRYKIEGCYLNLFSTDHYDSLSESVFEYYPSKVLPVAVFSVSYSANVVPTAQVTPVFGTKIGSDADIVLDAATQAEIEGAPCELIVKVRFPGDTEYRDVKMIRGVVSTISLQDVSGGPSSRVSVSLEVAHIASILGGAPSSSYVFSGNSVTQNLHTKDMIKGDVLSAAGAISNILGTSEEVGTSNIDLSTDERLYPARVLQKIIKALHAEFDQGDGTAESEIIELYDPTNLAAIPEFGLSGIGRSLLESFTMQWRTSNCLEALLNTCAYLNLRIVPYADGIYIVSAYPLDKNVKVSLSPSEYSSISKSKQANINKQVRGVRIIKEELLATAGAVGTEFIFPSSEDGSPLPNTYYFKKSYPRYLTELRDVLNSGDTTLEESGEKVLSITGRVLRMLFGEEQVKNTVATVRTPFRVDIMPGTVIEIKGLFDDGSPVTALGGVSYVGQVLRTSFACSAGQGSEAFIHTDITIGGLRTKEVNDKEEITFDGEPIYDGKWVGTKLSGELLSELPDHIKFNPA